MSGIISSPELQAAAMTARTLYEQGRYMEAWDTLAQAGDCYGDNAACVLGQRRDTVDLFFEMLVLEHGITTVGLDAYEQL
ncbi:MAG: hypothetical protein WC383_11415 [Gammaproteobacteria bacterium]